MAHGFPNSSQVPVRPGLFGRVRVRCRLPFLPEAGQCLPSGRFASQVQQGCFLRFRCRFPPREGIGRRWWRPFVSFEGASSLMVSMPNGQEVFMAKRFNFRLWYRLHPRKSYGAPRKVWDRRDRLAWHYGNHMVAKFAGVR